MPTVWVSTQVTIKQQIGGSKPWQQRTRRRPTRSTGNGGVSRLGEYLIAADRSITFRRPDGAPEEVPARSGSDADVYWACVDHNKMLLGITAYSSRRLDDFGAASAPVPGTRCRRGSG